MGARRAPNAFVTLPRADVTGVTPDNGRILGGDELTLTGEGFFTGMTVTVGGAAATSVVVVTSTSCTCITPIGLVGAKDVVVTTIKNADTLTGGFTYT